MLSRDSLHRVLALGPALSLLILASLVSAASAAPNPGSIAVQAFLDTDADGVAPTQGDPWLDGVHVTVSASGSPVADGVTVDGLVQFPDLPPGDYTVAADTTGWDALPDRADSDGGTDWSAVVTVASDAATPVAFTARGTASITGWISYTSLFRAPVGATATCTWGGRDGGLDTPDDLLFAASTQTEDPWVIFFLAHVPSGRYRCTAVLDDSTDSKEFDLVDQFEPTFTVGPPARSGFNGYIAFDVDGDGRYTKADKPLLGVTARLLKGDGTTLAGTSTTTADLLFYYFASFLVGDYIVEVPTAQVPGFTKFVGPDGRDGWVYPVNINIVDAGQFDFLAQGNSTIEVHTVDRATGATVDAAVECRWASVDHTMMTVDDLTWEVQTGADGNWSITNAPSGQWTCSVQGADGSTRTVGVSNGAHAMLELGVGSEAPTLPGTGWSPMLALIALALLTAGASLTRAARR